MPNPEQMGIKWWRYCQVCEWRAKTKGAVGSRENALTTCPNCNNPILSVEIDENVFEEKRYEAKVRNAKEQVVADEVRQNTGMPVAPDDTEDRSNNGHKFKDGEKPFPDPT